MTQMAIASMSIHWATDSFVIFRHLYPIEIAFGINIPVLVFSAVIFVLLMLDSRSKWYISLFIIIINLNSLSMIFLTAPFSLNAWVDEWDNQWSNHSHAMTFQLERSCCGWNSYEDRSIDECSFLSRSGCKPIVEDWIKVRYHQIFMTAILCLCLYSVTICAFLWAIFHDHIDCVWAEIEIPFISSNLYEEVQ